jgi:hypothetical protein
MALPRKSLDVVSSPNKRRASPAERLAPLDTAEIKNLDCVGYAGIGASTCANCSTASGGVRPVAAGELRSKKYKHIDEMPRLAPKGNQQGRAEFVLQAVADLDRDRRRKNVEPKH